ncbi:hypothetical protein EVAR_11046_1 [Eumeta japonica]|uniref:(+)RNA virus helicase C-terminal domain-containing protein n=1 Tax=Eumeta variegata TaxID=151549 RepID=A0A4C1U3P8_EUMVA|nr:hypothetical protein EVAR_11046_1 [Eumeta japonica]
MSVGYEKGNVEDYLGSIAASEKHKIVMYEDRGENLSFLHKYDPACSTTPIDSWGHPVKDPEEMSGSERLRKQIQAEKETKHREAKELAREQRPRPQKRVFDNRGQGKASTSKKITNDSPKSSPKPTKADLGEVKPPSLCLSRTERPHEERLPRLKRKLEENEGTIYNNKSSQYILGDARQNMAAYNDTCGLVYLDEQATKITGKAKYETPENDPIVENDQDYSETFTDWETPKITWINGVPGCGKTTWIVQEFDNKRDCIVTATIEAAEDLKRKLANRIGAEATTRVRTMASILVNGFKEHTHNRLLIDEAMMNHFGAIITAALLAKAKELLLIGDINQIPHIDRHNVFPMSYEKPNAVAKVSRELLRSYRNPMDVAYALNEIYSGIYSTQEGTRSLTMDGYDINKLSVSLPQTLYLAHTSWQNRAKSHGMRTRAEKVLVRSEKCQNLRRAIDDTPFLGRRCERIAEVHLPGDCGIFPVAHSREIREKPLTTHNYVSTWLRSQREESDTGRRALAAATVRHFGLPSVTINHGATEKKSTLRVVRKTYQVRSAVETSCKSVFAREGRLLRRPRPGTVSFHTFFGL